MNTAIIFAAGRGERLYPITRYQPKALCLIQDKPLIEYHIERLKKAGIKEIYINHAYLGDQIKRYLGNGQRFGVHLHYFAEPPGGLETGGTLIALQKIIPHEPFITVNADIYTEYPFEQLPSSVNTVHLVLVPYVTQQIKGNFGLTASGQIHLHSTDYLFSGIAVYHPKMLENETLHRFSIAKKLYQWAEEGILTGELYQGCWFDIGTPERLAHAQKLALSHACHPLAVAEDSGDGVGR